MRHALGAAEGFTSKQHLKNLLKEGLHLLRILAKNGQNARSVWHDLSLQQFFTMQYFVVEDAELRPIIFKLLSALFKESK
jgi:hypothetical protein